MFPQLDPQPHLKAQLPAKLLHVKQGKQSKCLPALTADLSTAAQIASVPCMLRSRQCKQSACQRSAYIPDAA
eukprot:1161967-Pelagomonas_calceolata.AAC.5